jgi:hypothetical protein
VIILLVMPLSLFAQTSAITGAVSDEVGNPIANAMIQATNIATQAYFHATTSATGEYAVERLPPGTYVLLVETTIGRYTKGDVIVDAGQAVRVDVHMPIGITLKTLGEADVATRSGRCMVLQRGRPPERLMESPTCQECGALSGFSIRARPTPCRGPLS